MIKNMVKLPAVSHINCNFNPTVVVYQKMHHHSTVLFLKCKNTTVTSRKKITNSSSVVVHSIKQVHANELEDDEEDDAEKDRVCVFVDRILEGEDEVYLSIVSTYGLEDEIYLSMVSTNGLGPKFELALENGMDDTIGIDLVAMSINELVTLGPSTNLGFYYDIDAGFSEKVISCMADACGSICSFYQDPRPDSTTKATARLKQDYVIDGKNIEVGDVLIGLPSSGIHSNGFSLVRKVLERSGCSLKDNLPGTNITLGESLMTPTVIYKEQVCEIITKGGVKGIAHIAAGGLTKSVTRVFPSGHGAVIFNDSWIVPPIFKWIQEVGKIGDAKMRRTFNMGIGMVLVVSKESAQRILGNSSKIKAYQIGEVVRLNAVRYQ